MYSKASLYVELKGCSSLARAWCNIENDAKTLCLIFKINPALQSLTLEPFGTFANA